MQSSRWTLISLLLSGCGAAPTPPPAPALAPTTAPTAAAPAALASLPAPAPEAASSSPALVETPPAPARVTPFSPATCTFSNQRGVLAGTLFLEVDGTRVAALDGRVDALELQFSEDGRRASVQVTTPALRLNTLVDVARLHLAQRPGANPLEGWLKLESVRVASVGNGRATVRVTLPRDVESKGAPATLELACADLSLIGEKTSSIGDTHLRPGTRTPLRAAIGGPVVAYLVEPAASTATGALVGALDAIADFPKLKAVDKRAGWVKVTQGGEATAVIGWIPASAVDRTRSAFGVLGMLSGSGTGGGSVRCRQDVPIQVRSDGQVFDVGVLRADANVAGERLASGAIRLRLDSLGLIANLLDPESSRAPNASPGDGPYVPEDSASFCTVEVVR